MKRLLAILSLILWTCCLWAQGTWTAYNNTNSKLAGNTILALAADQRHNLWVGTPEGLFHFKGRTWTDLSASNSKLEGQYVNCFAVDRNGVLWIGTDDYGPISYDGKEWKEYPAELQKYNMRLIHSIAIDINDVKWISVTLNGLVRYDGRNWDKYTPDDSELLSDFVLCTAIDRANRKWIGTNAGLCLYNGRTWTLFTNKNSRLPSNIVPAIAVDGDNIKWVGTDKGLCRFDGEKWQIFNTDNTPLPSNQINALTIDTQGWLWIATNKGGAVYDRQGKWYAFNASNSPFPAEANMQCVAADEMGTVWFGSDFYGLFALSDFKFPEPKPVEPSKEETAETAGADAKTGIGTGQAGTSSVTSATLDVKVVPYLDLGYIVLKYSGGEEATITFLDKEGKTVRTIEHYTSGKRIGINKLPKGRYTLEIQTAKARKTLKYNLK